MRCRRGLSMRILSVCLSVRLSHVETKRKSNLPRFFIPYERSLSLVFWEEEWLVRGDPFYLKFWVSRPSLERNRRFWINNHPSNASAVRPSENSSINTNRKPPTRFPTSLRWSSYVAHKSPKGGLKKAKRPFSLYNRNSLKKVCYKVSLCENCQRQSYRAFIGIIHAKIIGGGRPLQPEILG